MKTKRDLAASLVCIASIVVIAGYAYAAQRSEIAIAVLLQDPLVMTLLLVSCASIVGVAVLAYQLWRAKNTNCNNTACSFHPQYKGKNKGFDFSCIQTPSEFYAALPEDGAQRLVAALSGELPAVNEKAISQEFDREEWKRIIQEILPKIDEPQYPPIPLYVEKNPVQEEHQYPPIPLYVEKSSMVPAEKPADLPKEMSMDQPAENPSMELTEEMILMIVEKLQTQETPSLRQAS